MKDAATRRNPGRSGAKWNMVRSQVLASSSVCWLCSGPLDFDAPPRSPKSPTVDHIIPLAATRHWDPDEQERMATDPGNLRAAHHGCNSARRDRRPPRPRPGSRAW